MRLHLCVPAIHTYSLYDCVAAAAENATGLLSLCAFVNGPDPIDSKFLPVDRFNHCLLQSYSEAVGVPAALHELWKMVCDAPYAGVSSLEEIWCFVQDDLIVKERGWDERILRAFEDPKVGLVGFAGSTGLGVDDMYSRSFEPGLLGRINLFSNYADAETHGERTTEERECCFFDGNSLIVRRSILDAIDGWSWMPFDLVHYCYDSSLACQVRRQGYTGRLVPIAVDHLGAAKGFARSSPEYHALAETVGGDRAMHDRGHKWVYDTFRDVLPLRLQG